MRIVTSTDKLMGALAAVQSAMARATAAKPAELPRIMTDFPPIDSLLPGGGFCRRSVHEVLSPNGSAILPILVARSASQTGWIVWCDFTRTFYPPGAVALGLPLDRLVLLRATTQKEELWAATECLRSPGVAACVVSPPTLTFLQARRLQLAAERGGGVGLLLRPTEAMSRPYAAATRWWVSPMPGERTVQCWKLELIHGHGGQIGQSVLLEVCRETHHVRAIPSVVGRSGETKIKTIPA